MIQFCGSRRRRRIAGTSGFVVRKTSVIDFATIAVTAFHGLTGTSAGAGPFAPQGVDNDDPVSASGYFIGVDNASFGTLMLRRVIETRGRRRRSRPTCAIAVSPTAAPITVRHLGNLGGANGQLDGGDDRLTSASIVNGSLWTAQTIGVTHTGQASGVANRNGVRWYQIGSLTGTPTVMQSGTLFSNAGSRAASTSATTGCRRSRRSMSGRAVVGFSAAGTSEFVNAGVAERFSSDAAGTLRAPQLFTASAAAYNPPGDPGLAARGTPLGRRLVHGARRLRRLDDLDASAVHRRDQLLRARRSAGRWARAAPTPAGVTPSVIASGVGVDRPAGHRDIERRERPSSIRARGICAASARAFRA